MADNYEMDDWEIRQQGIEEAFNQADRTDHPLPILIDCYKKYQDHNPDADRIANDKEALQWLTDYWAYVCWNEHGNQCSMYDMDGFIGMANYIADPQIVGHVLDYLQYDDVVDDETQNLMDRLKSLASRYNGVSKMKKSNALFSIEDEYDSLSQKEKDVVESLCWTLQVNNPIIQRRGNDYYFLFSYYDGDPEYYFEDLNIEQDRENEYNYLNLSEIVRNPPEFMKSARKMKKSVDIEQLAHDIATIYEDIDPYAQRSAFNTFDDAVRGQYEALTTWSADEIEMSIINDLQEYADDGYEGDGTLRIDDIISRLREVVNMKKNMKTMKKSSIHDMIAQCRQNNNSLTKSRVDLSIHKMPREDFLYDPVMRNFPDYAYCDGVLNCTPFRLDYVGRESKETVAGYNNAIYRGSTVFEGFKGEGNVDLQLEVIMDMMSGEYTATVSTNMGIIEPNEVSVDGRISGVHPNSVASDFQIIDAIKTAINEFDNKARWI